MSGGGGAARVQCANHNNLRCGRSSVGFRSGAASAVDTELERVDMAEAEDGLYHSGEEDQDGFYTDDDEDGLDASDEEEASGEIGL